MEIVAKANKQFLIDLTKSNVIFILIGGYAVNYYGYARFTLDMDIWLKPDNDNQKTFISFLESQLYDNESIQIIRKIDFNDANSFHIGQGAAKIDFLTKISGVKFEEAYPICNSLNINENIVKVIHYRHLIINKMISDRSKDRADVDELQNINKYRNPPFE
jgi:hypothetical protein